MAQEVSLNYEPRSAFIPFHQRSERFTGMVCHRRAGKTVSVIHEAVIRAIRSKRHRPKYAYVGPYRQQAKEIAWEYLKDATTGLRKGPPRESDLKITLPNDATIQIYGADNAEALRGLYFDGVICDEYGDWRPSIWGEIVLPTLMDRDGWAVFVGTMKGKNHFYKMLEKAKKNPSWFYMSLKASESGILSPESLDLMREEMDDAQYQQEMECNENAAVKGTYYSERLAEMELSGQIGDYAYDPGRLVHVTADLGFTDSTALWFWQIDESGPIMIDYLEADSRTLDWYFDQLDGKGYDYAEFWLPHDAKAKTLQTGRSTIEQFKDHYKKSPHTEIKPVPKLAVQHGIDAARLMLKTVRIDADNCYGGVEALRAYRRQFNEKTKQFANAPLHDWSSNGSDSFRYFALVTAEGLEVEEEKIEALPILQAPEYTLNQLFEDNESDSWRRNVIRL